ncbi:MAG TPA: ethylbenzene dehydrogenase-related protein [Usitatibacter sp.]|nr:ethylbenzene dehydrogenase-related protein [Usitatibacter sp.]
MLKRTPLVFAALATFALGTTAFAADTLTAVKVTNAPRLASGASDPAWAKARPLSVSLSGGANFKDGATTAKLKAVYTADTLYLLVQYADPTESVRRSPYVKQPDGTWKKLADPDDKGGDNNKFYEDKVALIWNINHSIKGFGEQGCMVACHAGEAGKPFGNKYLQSEGELGDIWHLKTIRTGYIGQVDDQYVDHTRFDKEKAPEAGRKSDPKTAGGYADIKLKDGKPEFMHKSGLPARERGAVKVASGGKGAGVKGTTYYLRDEDKVAFDDSKFRPGDEVASIVVAPFTGDRGEIPAHIGWNKGQWTMVMSRKLATGSKYDVQFADLKDTYEFGLAAFDNAQVRHAFHTGSLKLKFAQ